MRREHIIDGWWQLPGEPVPALGWPGTKNGESHRIWLPKAGTGPARRAGRRAHRLRVRRAARSSGPWARRRDAGGLQASSASSGRRRTICAEHGCTITALGFGREAMNRIQNHQARAASPRLRPARVRRGEQAHDGDGGGSHHGAGRGADGRQGRPPPALDLFLPGVRPYYALRLRKTAEMPPALVGASALRVSETSVPCRTLMQNCLRLAEKHLGLPITDHSPIARAMT